jgi:hypothetical protein
MKLFIMMFVVAGSMSLNAYAGESTECKNIVSEGNKSVSCDKLAGAEKARCEAARSEAPKTKTSID